MSPLPLLAAGVACVVVGYMTEAAWLMALGIFNLLVAWADS